MEGRGGVKDYWEQLQEPDGSSDPVAIILGELKALLHYAEVIEKILPDVIARLAVGRKEIVIQTEKTFSDICTMIDEFNAGEESTYETAVKICSHYRKTVGSNT